jgi:hypothetical protein
MQPSPLRGIAFTALALTGALAPPVQGQAPDRTAQEEFFPRHGVLVTGYGSAGYRAILADSATPNDFQAAASPIFLFQIADRFLFEAEVEFALEEGVTEAELEYAQADVALTNNLKVVAGKFLLPFNIFTERLHPSWINSFVSTPPLYGGHHGSASPAAPLIPVLSDVGVQLRGTFDLGRFSYLTAAAFVSQGPRPAMEEEGEEPMGEEELPEIAFGTNFEDNNENKMVGARVGVGLAPYIEANLSVMRGDYDDDGALAFTGVGAHVEARYSSLSVHGEWVFTRVDVADELTGDVEPLDRHGYWAQASYRFQGWEPEVRWGQIFEGDLDGETVTEDGRQLTVGLVYWLQPSVGLKAEYLINSGEHDDDRVAVQWAFGF